MLLGSGTVALSKLLACPQVCVCCAGGGDGGQLCDVLLDRKMDALSKLLAVLWHKFVRMGEAKEHVRTKGREGKACVSFVLSLAICYVQVCPLCFRCVCVCVCYERSRPINKKIDHLVCDVL